MKYEMLYLIDSSIAEEARDALIAKFEEIVKNLGGQSSFDGQVGREKARLSHQLQERTPFTFS